MTIAICFPKMDKSSKFALRVADSGAAIELCDCVVGKMGELLVDLEKVYRNF